MHSVLAIFRKDVRRLHLQVLAFWLLLAISAVVEPYGTYWKDSKEPTVSTFALLACCYLIAAAIHQEPLAGDRQYWLTRPFTARQLLLEKALFIACSVAFPMLLAQIASLAILRIPPLHFAGALLWRMVVFAAVIILPVASLAAVTRNLTQFLLAVFLVLAAMLVLNLLFADPIFVPPWIGAGPAYLLLTLAGALLVLLQYTQRATIAGRLMLGAIVILFFFACKTELDDAVSATVRIARAPAPAHLPLQEHPFDIIAIPIRIEGVPPRAEALAASVHFTVDGAAGPDGAAIRDFAGGSARLTFPLVPNSMSAPVHVRGWVNITLFERAYQARPPADYEYLPVPGVGVCTKRQQEAGRFLVICLTPSPATGLALDFQTSLRWIIPPGIGSAFVDFTQPLQPVMRFVGYPGGMDGSHQLATAQSLVIVRTIANLRGEFDFPDIRLADYRVRE